MFAIPDIVGQTLVGGVSRTAQRVEQDVDVVSSGAEVGANRWTPLKHGMAREAARL